MQALRFLLVLLVATGTTACSSTLGPSAGSSGLFATAPIPSAAGQAASIAPSPSLSASETTWRVDVINGPRPIEIRFNVAYFTPLASSGDWYASAWRVEPNARVTLFDQASAARAGSFDLLQTSDDHPILGHCHVFVELPFQAESFTIVITGDSSGPDYTAVIKPGQPPLEPIASYPDTSDPQVANCSG